MVGPEAFFEVKYLAHAKQMEALDVIPEVAQRFAIDFGRPSGGLVRRYRTEGAETIIVALGSVLGTIESVVDEMREAGVRVGALGIKSFRPFPLEEVRRRQPAPAGWSSSRRRSRSGARDRLHRRPRGPARHARPLQHGGRRARRALDHPRVAA